MMKIGDLVTCKDDKNVYFGFGVVLSIETRMAFVYWFDDCDREWLWKCNLAIYSEKK